MKKIVVLSGAGISAESGLKTFRDANGLWENHDIMEVASPLGFAKNPELVLEFYNQRRQQLLEIHPNKAHIALAQLEADYQVTVITQNVDDLHERAGSSDVLHLHGELLKVRSTANPDLIYNWNKKLQLGDLCELNSQLRPHIVWFGEEVPMLPKAIEIIKTADTLIIVGTSMQVYPAASLIHFVKNDTRLFLIDPKPALRNGDLKNLIVLDQPATVGVPVAIEKYLYGQN